jgi:hypothetical protein
VADDKFTLTYGGEALESGLMDVRELAPALLSVGELIHSVNRLTNGDRAVVSLQVKSDFRKGSFQIDLVLVQNLIDQAKQFLQIPLMSRTLRRFWTRFSFGVGYLQRLASVSLSSLNGSRAEVLLRAKLPL